MPTSRSRRVAGLLAALVAGALALTGCSGSGGSHPISVFTVKPGDCFTVPSSVQAELSSLTKVPCTKPHTEEAYAVVAYSAAGQAPAVSTSGTPSLSEAAYPGDDVLSNFAQGACAQRYTAYVGVSYLESSLFFTYLLPSARSWEQADDRNVLCFVTTTGQKLTRSVKNSKL